MSTSTANVPSVSNPAGQAPNRVALAAVLLAGSAIGAFVAYGIAPAAPVSSAAADPELTRLLQGMALIKLVFVAAMAGLLVWRFGRPVSKPVATGYLFSVWTATAATVLIWQSAWLGLASILFHGAGLAFLLLGLRDDDVLPAGLRKLGSR